jgi:hypothetical protein
VFLAYTVVGASPKRRHGRTGVREGMVRWHAYPPGIIGHANHPTPAAV